MSPNFDFEKQAYRVELELAKFRLISCFLVINEDILKSTLGNRESLMKNLAELLEILPGFRHLATDARDFDAIIDYINDIGVISGTAPKIVKEAAWQRVRAWHESGRPSFIPYECFSILGDIVYFGN